MSSPAVVVAEKMSANSTGTSANSKVKCTCGRAAVVRTVKNGPNVGTKFYGCPSWPKTQCKMFVPIDDKDVVDDLHLNLKERDTTIAELEMIRKFNEDKIQELEIKNKNLMQEVDFLKNEIWQQKFVAIRTSSDYKHLSTALFVALIVVVIFYNLR